MRKTLFAVVTVVVLAARFATASPVAPLHVAASAHAGRNYLRLQRNADDVELRDDTAGTLLAARSILATSTVVIEGSSGDDTLIVDFTHGNPIPEDGLTFNGGAQV